MKSLINLILTAFTPVKNIKVAQKPKPVHPEVPSTLGYSTLGLQMWVASK